MLDGTTGLNMLNQAGREGGVWRKGAWMHGVLLWAERRHPPACTLATWHGAPMAIQQLTRHKISAQCQPQTEPASHPSRPCRASPPCPFQAKEFNETVQLSGIILTKLDGTARGGAVVSRSWGEHSTPCQAGLACQDLIT